MQKVSEKLITKWAIRVLVSFVGVVGVSILGFILFWVWAVSGRVQGIEFSPDGFQQRHFSYNKPILSQVGFWYSSWPENRFAHELFQLKVCPIRQAKTWHLASDNVTSIRSVDRHAEMLTNLLSTRKNDTDLYWIEWSKDHLPQAKKFWPLIQRLSFDKQYVVIPLVFRKAQELEGLPADQFDTELRKVIAEELALMIEEYQQQGDTKQVQNLENLRQSYLASTGPLAPPQELNDKPMSESDFDGTYENYGIVPELKAALQGNGKDESEQSAEADDEQSTSGDDSEVDDSDNQ